MSCEEYDEQLLRRAHGLLGPVERSAVEAHLRRCPSCRQRAASFQTAPTLLTRAAQEAGVAPAGAAGGYGPARRFLPAASASSPLFIVMTALAALTIIACVALVIRRQAAQVAPTPVSAPPAIRKTVPCTPDLPNDHCR